MRRQRRLNINDQLRIPTTRSLVVNHASYFLNPIAKFVADAIQLLRVSPEDLDLHRFGIPLQVSQHVLQDLNEFDVDAGDAVRDLVAQICDSLLDVAVALRPRFEFDEDVTLILLSREKA